MSIRKKNFFGESLATNMLTYNQYFMQLTEIAISRFKWNNLPSTVDGRYIERTLFQNSAAVYFNDEYMGNLCLDVITQGNFNVYGYPIYLTSVVYLLIITHLYIIFTNYVAIIFLKLYTNICVKHLIYFFCRFLSTF